MAIPHESLGLELQPGDEHYRAFVGPPGDYDLVAAMSFGLLTTLGLRQHHRILDLGCGSLRIGRLLIPYLNRGGYTGLEPNAHLVDEGIAREVGRDQIRIKQPTFVFSETARSLIDGGRRFDFILAQSIFSHCGIDLVERWLGECSSLLTDDGALVATYLSSQKDTDATGWIYPGCVTYVPDTLARLAGDLGLEFIPLQWRHPRQQWALFAKPGFDGAWYQDKLLAWSTCMDRVVSRRQLPDAEQAR